MVSAEARDKAGFYHSGVNIHLGRFLRRRPIGPLNAAGRILGLLLRQFGARLRFHLLRLRGDRTIGAGWFGRRQRRRLDGARAEWFLLACRRAKCRY